MSGDADENPLHPLIEAIEHGDVKGVEELLSARADPNVTGIGVPALGWAVQIPDDAALNRSRVHC